MSNEKELCDCGKVAVWCYAPGFDDDSNPYVCDDCVGRGCTCNYHYVRNDSRGHQTDNQEMPTKEDEPIKWIEEGKIWCHLDEKGREFPCCEYDYDENGYDKE